MASHRPEEKDYVHYRLLRLLQGSPDLSQREIARQLGISTGGIHYCLNALIAKGLIKLGNFATSRHKLGYAYLLTPEGIAQKAAMTSRFLQQKMEEYEALMAEIDALKSELESQKVKKAQEA